MDDNLQVGLAIVLLTIIEFYFNKKVTSSLRTVFGSSNKIKTGSLLFLTFLNIYPLYGVINLLIDQLKYGRPYSQPQGGFFDYFIFFPFTVMVLVMVQSIIFLLPMDLLRLALTPIFKKYKEKMRVITAYSVVVIAAGFFVYVPVRIIYDYSVFEVREVEFRKANLPEGLNNFKIAFIADIQADVYNNRQRVGKYIDKVNETKPDLVLVGGDVITETPDYINVAAEYLGDIKSRLGVYSCIGDHDNWAYASDNQRSVKEVSTALKERKVDMLDNQNRVFNAGSNKIGVTFVTNTYFGRIGKELLGKLTSVNNSDIKILVTHQPSQYLVDMAKEANYDMLLAGHTHGGQLTFLFPFHNLTLTEIETKYIKGDFHFGNMLMVVTRGLGMSTVPFRYNSTPEITVITLKKAA